MSPVGIDHPSRPASSGGYNSSEFARWRATSTTSSASDRSPVLRTNGHDDVLHGQWPGATMSSSPPPPFGPPSSLSSARSCHDGWTFSGTPIAAPSLPLELDPLIGRFQVRPRSAIRAAFPTLSAVKAAMALGLGTSPGSSSSSFPCRPTHSPLCTASASEASYISGNRSAHPYAADVSGLPAQRAAALLEGGPRVSPSSTHPRGMEGAALQQPVSRHVSEVQKPRSHPLSLDRDSDLSSFPRASTATTAEGDSVSHPQRWSIPLEDGKGPFPVSHPSMEGAGLRWPAQNRLLDQSTGICHRMQRPVLKIYTGDDLWVSPWQTRRMRNGDFVSYMRKCTEKRTIGCAAAQQQEAVSGQGTEGATPVPVSPEAKADIGSDITERGRHRRLQVPVVHAFAALVLPQGQRRRSQQDRDEARQDKVMRKLNLPMPTYDGSENLAAYEAFVYEWDAWIRPLRLPESTAVRLMCHALKGEAKDWYMLHVALDNYPWTTREVYAELWETCFSDDFRENLRERLMNAKQAGRPIKDFAKDLRNLAVRFPDIDEWALKRIFRDGADPYIQLFWAEKGRSIEYDDISTLLIYAQRAERREKLLQRLLKAQEQEQDSGAEGESEDENQASGSELNRSGEHEQESEGSDEPDRQDNGAEDDYDGADDEEYDEDELEDNQDGEYDDEEYPVEGEYSEEDYDDEEPEGGESHKQHPPDDSYESDGQDYESDEEYDEEDY